MSDERDEERLPPIPDGGLSESMPEWLRRPPAWRTLKDADVSQTVPSRTDRLPDEDTSVIDPRTFLTEDDLPAWLRNMGSGRQLTSAVDQGDDEGIAAPSEDRNKVATSAPPAADAPITSSPPATEVRRSTRFVPRTPPVLTSDEAEPRTGASLQTPATAASAPATAATPWWRGTPMILVLSSLLVVAVVVIVVLAVA